MNNPTIFTAYNETKKLLSAAGIEDYALEARHIIRYITGYDNAKILSNYSDKLSPLQQTVLKSIVSRRCTHYPLQYILGSRQFYGINFKVGEGVLIPRPDTENLVDIAVEFLKDKKISTVLDLCAGSGCIAVSVAKNTSAEVTAIEKYDGAFKYLEENIKQTKANVKPIKADIFEYSPNCKFDLIVSNPPYIADDEKSLMTEETFFEPKTALFAENKGLAFYEKIIPGYAEYIKSGGMLAVEIGFSQGDAVKRLFEQSGYENITVKKDYSGNQRVVFGTVKPL